MRLLTWLSPAFPVGAYAYSHGLEWAVETRDIQDENSLRDWLIAIIAHGSGRNDTILLRHAHRVARERAHTATRTPAHRATRARPENNLLKKAAVRRPEVNEIVSLALASTTSRERREEALAQGRAFLLAVSGWGVPELPADTPYAVAVGATAGAHGIDEDTTANAFLQSFTSNLISAAVRLVPLGQTAGLRTLASLEPLIFSIATETAHATLDDLGGCAFRSDLAAMRHETQYTRLFRS
jgi:urease accessory protein